MNDPMKNSLILEQKRIEAILKNKQTTAYWEQRKTSHEEVEKNLKYYETKLQEFIMVPIGKRALIKGRIVNTNQIFVPIGNGYFVKVCSMEAQNICKRRIDECNNMLENLAKERKLFEGWTALRDKCQIFPTEDVKEIIEPYDEQEEKLWREQHAEKVKDHKKKLSDVRQQLDDSRCKVKQSESDLWKHLDLLELQEEFEDELDRLGNEDNDESDDDYDDISDSESSSLDSDDEPSNKNKFKIKLKDKYNATIINNKTADHLSTCSEEDEDEEHQKIENKLKLPQLNLVKKKTQSDIVKKVTFDETKVKVADSLVENTTNIAFGEIIEHPINIGTSVQKTVESRPVSKFKSSKKKVIN